MLNNAIIDAVILCPEVKAYLSPAALQVCKSYDYYLRTLTHLVTTCYNGQLAADDFRDIMDNLVLGQLSDAYEKAMAENGLMPDEATITMREQLQAFVEGEQGFVDQLSRDIIDTRIDEKPIDGLLARVNLWANRYNEVYNAAQLTITAEFGGKLIWKLGATEEHCPSCSALDGLVAFATEWDQSGVHTQGAPNAALQCGGWNCDCSCLPTDRRRSPRALDRIMDIATAANV